MGINLLTAAPANTTGNPVDTRSIDRIQISIRIFASGVFAGSPVIIEQSPDGGVTWYQIGTLATGTQLAASAPIDLVRARTDGALTGNATAIMEVSG